MKIALVWPKSTFLDNPMVWPPLGLLYLSSQLKAQGHTTEFYDLNFTELPKDGEYDQVWLSATSPQMQEIKRVADITKNWKTKTVLGGAGPWANPDSCKNLGFDLIVGGESDHPESIRKIIDTVKNGSESYILLPISRTLDWVLPPDRKWTQDYYSYMTDAIGNKYRMSSLFTSRGCPMECAFCESGRHGIIWDRLTRYESIDIVEHQIKEIKSQGFNGLAYYDDILPLNKKRTYQIMDLHRKYDMKYRCFLRSDIINKQGGKEYLEAMRDGGLIQIFVGIESASNKQKDSIHKGTTIEQDTNVLQWCRELGILFKGSFILGLPGETRETMEETKKWILSQNPEGIRIQVDRLIPFPGTPLGDHPELYDLKYERQVDDNFFYAGRDDLEMHSFVSTSSLSLDEIDDFWRNLEKEMKEKGFRN